MKNQNTSYQIELFHLSSKNGVETFDEFKKNNPSTQYIDTLGEQKYELAVVRNPELIRHKSSVAEESVPVSESEGVWVYFPWKNTAVRILKENEYQELRLSRNKNLITTYEEKILNASTIGVVGLNVGNPGAICIALEGISNNIKLADFDPLSVSNLNRFRSGVTELGINKAHISARQIYEINPYARIELYSEGVTQTNISDFLNYPKLDILIEEMDNLKLKLEIRKKAKEHKIPVIMVTGNGENVLVDVERYDIEEDLPVLSGYLKENVINRILEIREGEGSYQDRIELAKDFMGEEYLDKRLVSSFGEVGTKLAGIPQLAESSFLRGAAIAHFAKKILLKEHIPSGRYTILLSGQFLKNDKRDK